VFASVRTCGIDDIRVVEIENFDSKRHPGVVDVYGNGAIRGNLNGSIDLALTIPQVGCRYRRIDVDGDQGFHSDLRSAIASVITVIVLSSIVTRMRFPGVPGVYPHRFVIPPYPGADVTGFEITQSASHRVIPRSAPRWRAWVVKRTRMPIFVARGRPAKGAARMRAHPIAHER